MKITKIINGHEIELLLDKIKEYARYSIYQVSKMVNGVKVPLYQECFSDFEIGRLVKEGYNYHTFGSGGSEDEEEQENID